MPSGIDGRTRKTPRVISYLTRGMNEWTWAGNMARRDVSRALTELLGKYICSILPARTEYFSSQKGATKIFPSKNVFAWPKKRGWKCTGRKTNENFSGGSRSDKSWLNVYNTFLFCYLITLFYVSQEESVLGTDCSKNSCRWLLSMCVNKFTPELKKYTFSQPCKEKCISEVVRIGSHNHLSSDSAMENQVLHSVWCYISGDTAGGIRNWSPLGLKGLTLMESSKKLVYVFLLLEEAKYTEQSNVYRRYLNNSPRTV